MSLNELVVVLKVDFWFCLFAIVCCFFDFFFYYIFLLCVVLDFIYYLIEFQSNWNSEAKLRYFFFLLLFCFLCRLYLILTYMEGSGFYMGFILWLNIESILFLFEILMLLIILSESSYIQHLSLLKSLRDL